MTEKTSNYFNVDSLLSKVENTKFILHAVSTSDNHKPGFIARDFDEIAEELYEEFYDECFADMYGSKMRELKRERLECMTKIGNRLTEYYGLLNTLTGWSERCDLLHKIVFLLTEYDVLLNQCERSPWARY